MAKEGEQCLREDIPEKINGFIKFGKAFAKGVIIQMTKIMKLTEGAA